MYFGRMNLLSVQSHVAYGHVGNSAATFPLQRLGIEVWPLHTVQFSNHTGYGSWKGIVFDAAVIRDLVTGIAERGALRTCDGVLSGYMGSAEIGEAILDTVLRVRRANPAARYCCDPVIGDVGQGVFVRPGIPEFMRDRAIAAADVITPNQFELDFLSGRTTHSLPEALAAAEALRARGPSVVLVTSLDPHETPPGCIALFAIGPAGRYRVRTPKLPITVNGAGDAIAALFFAHVMKGGPLARALAAAASSVFGILKRTAECGSREIVLVAAQDEIVNPSRVFEPQEV